MIKKINFPVFFSLILALSACTNDGSKTADQGGEKEGMTQFADDKSFQDKHELPEEISYQGIGKMVTLQGSDDQAVNAYVVVPQQYTGKALFVFHEWWGLNDQIKREADRLFDSLGNVMVIAPDMYDGKVATTREDAAEYMKAFNMDRGRTIIFDATRLAGDAAQIATIGWCFGGGLSLKASILLGSQAAGCVMYYGMPVENAKDLAPLKTDILGIFAEQDQSINAKVVQHFKGIAQTAGKKLTVHTYDADHAFANPSSPRYNEKAATEANEVALKFLREKLR